MADASSQLSRGALKAIFFQPDVAAQQYQVPIFQCLQVKPMAPGGTGERYRVVISDFQDYCQGMLATQANHLVHDGKLVRGCIVRCKSYNASSIKGKPYVPPQSSPFCVQARLN